LLRALREIEESEGRVRTARWGARTLDLDLLIHGDYILDTPDLILPHPRMALRRFVLAPLAEIAAEVVDPVTGRSISSLRANLDRRPSYLVVLEPRDQPSLEEVMFQGLTEPVDPPSDPNSLSAQVVRALSAQTTSILPSTFEEWVKRLPEDLDDKLARLVHQLDEGRWLNLSSPDRWLVTDFWFDELYLSLDSLKTARPRFSKFRDRFLEARAHVVPPTFVAMSRQHAGQLRLHEPRLAWQRPIGWDTPIYFFESADTEANLAELLAVCAGTR